MDKRMFSRWFNGLYGKLTPERQLAELDKLKSYVVEFADAKKVSFERNHVCCKECGKYSLKKDFVKKDRIISKKAKKGEVDADMVGKKRQYHITVYTCPKCESSFIYDEQIVKVMNEK